MTLTKGTNRARWLRSALKRFASMLIAEARDFTGLNDAALDRALSLSFPNKDEADGVPRAKSGNNTSSYRYLSSRRAPPAGKLQSLENCVAKLLCRPAHLLVVREAVERGPSAPLLYLPPRTGLKRYAEPEDVEIAYDNSWPTYADFLQFGKFDRDRPWDEQPELVKAFGWQWGHLRHQAPADWQQRWCHQFNQIPRHWLLFWCRTLGLRADMPIETLLPTLVQEMSKRPGLIDRWTSERSVIGMRANVPDTSLAGPPGWGSVAETLVQVFLEDIVDDDELGDSLPEFCRKDGVTQSDDQQC